MKEYLVDVPVAMQAFVRPEMLEKQWEVICKARPSTLIIRSDGPRKNVPSDFDRIKASREIVQEIDWECDVHRLYFDENQGLYKMADYANDYIWQRFDRCIFIEDDLIPSVSFFKYCEYLLDKYKDDTRIYCIHGVNLCGTWDKTDADYFFARVPASSGVAFWRRTFLTKDYELNYKKNEYVKNLIYKTMPWYLRKQFKEFETKGTYANHPPASEFYVRYAEVCQNQVVIVPKYNLINNIGIGKGSTHTADNIKSMPKSMHKLYNMKTYELEFPLKDNEFVIPDVDFEKIREKQLGVASRTQNLVRSASRGVRMIIHGDGHRLIDGIYKRVGNIIEK